MLYTGDEITLGNYRKPLKNLLSELRILHLLKEYWKQRKVPTEWKTTEVISLYRNSCSNHRRISLLNLTYKLIARILNNRLKNITDMSQLEDQNGFSLARTISL